MRTLTITAAEAAALALYLDRLHDDDLHNVLEQFRRLALAARDRHLRGEAVKMSAPGDSVWLEWRGDLHAAGVIIARIRDHDITDPAAWACADVYVGATDAVRRIYLLIDGRCAALDDFDALEAADDPDAVVPF